MSVRTLSQTKLSASVYNKKQALTYGYGSVLFASGDYLTIANNNAFKYSAPSGNTNDYTIEFWCYPTTTGTSAPVCIAYSTGYWAFFHNYSSAGGVEYYQGDAYQMNSGVSALTTGQWQHIAVSRSGSTTRLYVKGVEKATSTASYAASSSSSLCIGNDPVLGRPFVGRISNLRIVKGTALYTAGFTPPTKPLTAISGTTLLTCNDTTIKDYSTNALTITTGGGSPTAGSTNPFA